MKIKLSKNQWEEMGKKAGWLKTSQLMSNYNYLDLGPTPNGENCAQVGNTIYDYYQLSKIENEAYAHQLMRMFPDMPAGLRIIRKSNPHDFGAYHELNLKWVDGDDVAEEFAYKIEGSSPENWDEEAKAELTAKGYFVELEKGKNEKEIPNNLKDEANEPIEPEASTKNAKRVLKMAFEEKMMPGQTPYTKEEKSIKDSLIGDAARAEETVGIDELDNGPTLKQKMMDFLKSRYGGGSAKDSAEIAIYWFANHYHGGQWSELYSILSTSPYRPGPMGNLEKEGEEIQMMYEDLESVKAFRK